MSGSKKIKVGVGMPEALHLQDFGQVLYDAFNEVPYHVGSSLFGKQWRDVDVRIILDDDDYASMGFGDPAHPHANRKWVAMVKAFSELGRRMTGLPIDFQIQQRSQANGEYTKEKECYRSALLRRAESKT